jgi:hypothetical protein
MRDTVDASWALQYVGKCHGGQGCGCFRYLLHAAAVARRGRRGNPSSVDIDGVWGWPVPARSKECMR